MNKELFLAALPWLKDAGDEFRVEQDGATWVHKGTNMRVAAAHAPSKCSLIFQGQAYFALQAEGEEAHMGEAIVFRGSEAHFRASLVLDAGGNHLLVALDSRPFVVLSELVECVESVPDDAQPFVQISLAHVSLRFFSTASNRYADFQHLAQIIGDAFTADQQQRERAERGASALTSLAGKASPKAKTTAKKGRTEEQNLSASRSNLHPPPPIPRGSMPPSKRGRGQPAEQQPDRACTESTEETEGSDQKGAGRGMDHHLIESSLVALQTASSSLIRSLGRASCGRALDEYAICTRSLLESLENVQNARRDANLLSRMKQAQRAHTDEFLLRLTSKQAPLTVSLSPGIQALLDKVLQLKILGGRGGNGGLEERREWKEMLTTLNSVS